MRKRMGSSPFARTRFCPAFDGRAFACLGEGTPSAYVTPSPNPFPRGRGSASEEAVRACRPCRFAPKGLTSFDLCVRLGAVLHTEGCMEGLGVHWKNPGISIRKSGPIHFEKLGFYRLVVLVRLTSQF